MKVEIYTDGSCKQNGRKNAIGGWGYVILQDGKEVARDSGAEKNTTNQRMELTAAIKALECAMERDSFIEVTLYSDSAYMINCKKQHWYKSWEINGWHNSKKEPVANADLWKKLIFYFDNDAQFNFVKVKGHAGRTEQEQWNEVVDNIAVEAAKSYSERS